MSATISHSGRKPLSVVDRSAAPVAERAEAFATFLAYAGLRSLWLDRTKPSTWCGNGCDRIGHAVADDLSARLGAVALPKQALDENED